MPREWNSMSKPKRSNKSCIWQLQVSDHLEYRACLEGVGDEKLKRESGTTWELQSVRGGRGLKV